MFNSINTLDLFVIIISIAVALISTLAYWCGRFVGYWKGWRDSSKEPSGWENEALWWRKNSVGIVNPDDRQDIE